MIYGYNTSLGSDDIHNEMMIPVLPASKGFYLSIYNHIWHVWKKYTFPHLGEEQ
jgi:hypothetical protein